MFCGWWFSFFCPHLFLTGRVAAEDESSEVARLRRQVSDLSADVSRLNSDLSAARAQCSAAEAERDMLAEERNQWAQQLDDGNAQLKALYLSVQAAKDQLIAVRMWRRRRRRRRKTKRWIWLMYVLWRVVCGV